MKGMDLFCASPASTAICTGSNPRSMIRSHGGTGRPVHRHSPHHRHHHGHLPRRSQSHVPCSSQLMPIVPRPYCEKPRASSSKQIAGDACRKSSADIYDLKSPSGSSRFLLSDVAFSDLMSDEPSDRNNLLSLVPAGQTTMNPRHTVSSAESPSLKLSQKPTVKPRLSVSSSESPSLRSSQSTRARDQVVVLRVSLHCKGCESKLRKHLAKMEGVTSYGIDMETKKVTIRGDITPLGILSSVSRVKYAQLWSSPSSSSTVRSPSWSA
ncbi:protein SODIUM POTASSIUM ROOT DEFECTIVE 1-like [Punica granatum]|uniref:HMA domain-containing protein n=2 Tax=Punica granatum TaxID=22663 RepID=A0A218XX22_PUNGR|nr:protein SODIUM POTASSIUM ROOT DEFECTIVE 1-like [Punica granatum]XP_031384952.1 protein SODIUM POTASSIUM ROOT DEFECTIVE 1-like [Punica granatum]OWM89328.1 hypothetical protein CDL15_Pgr024073 [Punica granatum]PKI61670.1 hypothetical protein CRG98_017894 [Punica granatum]